MFDWKLIASPSFWFSLRWNPLTFETAMLMAGVFVALNIAGAAVLVLAGKKKKSDPLMRKAMIRMAFPLIFAADAGLLFTFFAYQQIPLFSGRFWFLFILAAFIAAEIPAVRYLMRTVPKLRAEQGARAQLSEYFPKKK